jgi:hypothetical protein
MHALALQVDVGFCTVHLHVRCKWGIVDEKPWQVKDMLVFVLRMQKMMQHRCEQQVWRAIFSSSFRCRVASSAAGAARAAALRERKLSTSLLLPIKPEITPP